MFLESSKMSKNMFFSKMHKNVSFLPLWEGGSRAGVIPNLKLHLNTQVLAHKTATGTFAK